MVAGGLLLSVFVVPTVYGNAMAHLAVAQFRSQSRNHSLWDSARIRAYQETLGISMPSPEAILRVPKAGIEVPVFEGTSDLVLNRGVGHLTGTAQPGQPGNTVIAGHRDGFFRGLNEVSIGDHFQIEHPAPNGTSHTDTYTVQKIRVVFPQDTSVLQPTTSSGTTLTLITCYPFYYVGAAPERYIIQAALIPQS